MVHFILFMNNTFLNIVYRNTDTRELFVLADKAKSVFERFDKMLLWSVHTSHIHVMLHTLFLNLTVSPCCTNRSERPLEEVCHFAPVFWKQVKKCMITKGGLWDLVFVRSCVTSQKYIYRLKYDGRLCFQSVHHPEGGLPHLHSIILSLVPCPFWVVPQWLVTGPFWGEYPVQVSMGHFPS